MKEKVNLIRQLHAALSSVGIKDPEQKHEMIHTFTEGRTESTKDLSTKELETLIQRINATKQGNGAKYGKHNLLRRRVISKFREMGCNKYDPIKRVMVADMQMIETKLVEHWGKSLNEFSAVELRRLIGVLEGKFVPGYYKNKTETNGAEKNQN